MCHCPSIELKGGEQKNTPKSLGIWGLGHFYFICIRYPQFPEENALSFQQETFEFYFFCRKFIKFSTGKLLENFEL